MTAFINLNNKKQKDVEEINTNEANDDHSASPIHDDDRKSQGKELVINKTQPIMAYQSQTKTEKSYKDGDLSAKIQKIDTGKTLKQGELNQSYYDNKFNLEQRNQMLGGQR